MADAEKGLQLEVDLPSQTISRPSGEKIPFEIDAFRKDCLINGLDDIGLTLKKEAAITAFEATYQKNFPWMRGIPAPAQAAPVAR